MWSVYVVSWFWCNDSNTLLSIIVR